MKTLILAIVVVAVSAKANSAEKFTLYELTLENEQQQNVIWRFFGNNLFDFLSTPQALGLPTTVVVHPEAQAQFLDILKQENIPFSVLVEDVESAIQEEYFQQKRARKTSDGKISFDEYNSYEDVEKYIHRLANEYPDIVKLEKFQTTYENRSMWLVKIGAENPQNPVILIDGGIHAREWISPAVVVYIICQLVENTGNRNLIENISWYIVPVLNPDGYEYSQSSPKPEVRLWRLNRAPVKGETCKGTDLNRNFGFHWGEKGVFHEPPCNEVFPGKSAFDQLESAGLRDVVNHYKDRIKLYVSVHNYAQMIIYPWAYTLDPPSNAKELQYVSEIVAKSLENVRGTKYKAGPGIPLVGYAAGASDDWVKAIGGVELSFTFELPSFKWEFLVPPTEILGISEEAFEGMKAFHNYITQKFLHKIV